AAAVSSEESPRLTAEQILNSLCIQQPVTVTDLSQGTSLPDSPLSASTPSFTGLPMQLSPHADQDSPEGAGGDDDDDHDHNDHHQHHHHHHHHNNHQQQQQQ
ncbi:hypothetical protein Ahia01_000847000, partial [Argonauta hians]